MTTQPAGERSVPSGGFWLTALVTIAAATSVYAIRQADPDLFGYLVYGRLFVEEGLGVADPFAYTSAGSHWVAFEYLAQIALWVFYDRFGPVGLIALKCLLGGLAIYFLSLGVRTTTSNPIVWVPVFVLCASTVSRYFLFRPQLFTFMLFALYVAVLFRFLVRGHAPLWLLPIAMLIWANAHGGYLAGLAAVALAIALCVCRTLIDPKRRFDSAWDGKKALSLTLAACALVSLVNPQGLRLWQYVLTEVLHGTNRRYIAEWQPPGLNSDPWSAVALMLIGAVVLVVGAFAQTNHRRVAGLPPWLWVASCVPAITFASVSVRHVPLAALWAAPVITLLADSVWSLPRPSLFNRAWMIIGGLSLVPLVVTLNYIVSNPRPEIAIDGPILGPTHPCTSVAFMKRSQLRGNLYAPLWWGSYISWELYPDVRVSMDGRNISLFPPRMVEENLQFYANDSAGHDLDAPFRYSTDMLLVPADRRVLALTRADRRWREIFHDDQASLFVHAQSGVEPASAPDSSTPTLAGCPSVLR